MRQKSSRVALLSLLALLVVVVAAPTAQAQVNFERETHFRCYIVSQQTPSPPAR